MEGVAVTRVGSLLIIHRDNPPEATIRQRVSALLLGAGRLPVAGIVEAWAGDTPDEFHWKTVVGLYGVNKGALAADC